MVVSSGADYLLTYVGVAALNSLTLVSALLWLPKGSVLDVATKRPETETIVERGVGAQDERSPVTQQHQQQQHHTSYVTSPKLMSSLTSPLYLLHVLWFSMLQFRLFFFVSDLNRWLTTLTEGALQQVDHYTSVQLYTGCSSVLFAILAGCLYDWQRHRYQDSPSHDQRHLGGAALPLMAASSSCCVLSVLVLVPEQHVLYVTFVILAAYRSFMYSLAAAFISLTFPAELFGVLYGTMVICGGIVGSLIYPLFIWSEASQDSVLHVNLLLLGTTVLTFVHPLHILWRCRLEPEPTGSSKHAAATTVREGPFEKERMMVNYD